MASDDRLLDAFSRWVEVWRRAEIADDDQVDQITAAANIIFDEIVSTEAHTSVGLAAKVWVSAYVRRLNGDDHLGALDRSILYDALRLLPPASSLLAAQVFGLAADVDDEEEGES